MNDKEELRLLRQQDELLVENRKLRGVLAGLQYWYDNDHADSMTLSREEVGYIIIRHPRPPKEPKI